MITFIRLAKYNHPSKKNLRLLLAKYDKGRELRYTDISLVMISFLLEKPLNHHLIILSNYYVVDNF